MFGQSSQQTTGFGGFGSTTGASGTGGGHQRSNTSLFTPAASSQPSTGLFGASTSTAPATSTAITTTPSFGGFGTSTTGNTTANSTTGFGFGNTGNSTTTTSTSAAPATGGLFGNTTSTTGAKPSFGGFGTTTNTSAQAGGLKFGTNTTQQPSGGLFGSTTGGQQQQTSSLFGGAQQQQQQQQQSDSLLSLRTSFPDTNVPHFIVKPDKVTRTSIPPSLFNKDDQTTTTKLQQDISTATTARSTSAKAFGAPRTTLPGFLTSATAPVNATKPGQKRVFEGQSESDRRRTLYKQSSNHTGVFGMSGDEGFGDSSSRLTKEIDEPPVVSIWDIGVNPRKYSTSPDTTKASNKPDAWTLAVMHHPQSNSGKLSMNQDTNSSGNSLLSATMNTATTCTISHNTNASSNTNKGSTMVKVFGYPADMKVTVIEFFSKCGQIEERYQSGSNWMTFRYSSSDAAKEALGYHGTLMTKECMIGVIEAKSMAG